MGCKLIQEYERNITKYLRYKHQVSKKSHRDRQNRVKKFLEFCCRQGIKSIKGIKQSDYDGFVQTFLEKFSTETKRKYQLALREFFERAHLNIRINVKRSIRNTKEKKFKSLTEICDCECLKEHKDEILNLL